MGQIKFILLYKYKKVLLLQQCTTIWLTHWFWLNIHSGWLLAIRVAIPAIYNTKNIVILRVIEFPHFLLVSSMLFELVAIADSCGFLLGFYVCAITMPYVIYNVHVIILLALIL